MYKIYLSIEGSRKENVNGVFVFNMRPSSAGLEFPETQMICLEDCLGRIFRYNETMHTGTQVNLACAT